MTANARPIFLITTALWHIEAQLSDELNLERLADLCGVSSAHLTRAMRLSTGYSPMAYVRARTLTQAAKRLAATKDDIIYVALDAGYGSHEAFSRAFAAAFGCQPSALRRGTPLSTLALTEPLPMTNPIDITLAPPRIETRPAFVVTGMADHFTFDSIPAIPALWAAFNEDQNKLTSVQACAYGISYDTTGGDGFRYLAGFATAPDAATPDGMTRLDIPAGRYAVYVHEGHVSQMHLTMKAIFDTGLASAGLTARAAPELEVYDDHFDVKSGTGAVELWIPVQ